LKSRVSSSDAATGNSPHAIPSAAGLLLLGAGLLTIRRGDLRRRDLPPILLQTSRREADLVPVPVQLSHQRSGRSRIRLHNSLEPAILRHNRPPPRLHSPRRSLRSTPSRPPDALFRGSVHILGSHRRQRPLRNFAPVPLVRERRQIHPATIRPTRPETSRLARPATRTPRSHDRDLGRLARH